MLLFNLLITIGIFMEQIKKRGRPRLNNSPMTGTERKQRHRDKLAASGIKTITIELSGIVIEILDRYRLITGESRSDAIENALMTWAIDTAEALPKLEEWAKQRNESLKNKEGK